MARIRLVAKPTSVQSQYSIENPHLFVVPILRTYSGAEFEFKELRQCILVPIEVSALAQASKIISMDDNRDVALLVKENNMVKLRLE